MGWAARSRRRAPQDDPFPLATGAQRDAARQILAERGKTPEGALEVAANAHDFASAMATAAAEHTAPGPACAAGCAWCCHRPVPALALDVFHAAAAVAALPEPVRERVQQRIEHAAGRHAALDGRELAELREPCPLLVDGRCSIYDSRPAACIARNAPDPEPCRLDVEQRRPTTHDANQAVAILPALMVGTAEEVLHASLAASGRSPASRHASQAQNGDTLRFVPALAAVLRRGVNESLARWLAGEPAFDEASPPAR